MIDSHSFDEIWWRWNILWIYYFVCILPNILNKTIYRIYNVFRSWHDIICTPIMFVYLVPHYSNAIAWFINLNILHIAQVKQAFGWNLFLTVILIDNHPSAHLMWIKVFFFKLCQWKNVVQHRCSSIMSNTGYSDVLNLVHRSWHKTPQIQWTVWLHKKNQDTFYHSVHTVP